MSDASTLCQACGLCCRGVFHTHGTLERDDTVDRGQLAMDISGEQDQFLLPCPAWQENLTGSGHLLAPRGEEGGSATKTNFPTAFHKLWQEQ